VFDRVQKAITAREVSVAPGRVWHVLADGRRYADWVVGASQMRDVEPSWPAVGSKFHHTVGIWPLHLKDTTAVEVCEVGRRLVLEARARPFGRARVEINLEASSSGTRIVMFEEARSPTLVRWSNPILTPLIHVRNTVALRRLAALCERSDSPRLSN
jgi:hypothetical protein